MEPGRIATVPVVFIEDRGGRHWCACPTARRQALAYNSRTETTARGHLTPEPDNSAVTAYCLDCDWSHRDVSWGGACQRLGEHVDSHRSSLVSLPSSAPSSRTSPYTPT